MNSLNRFIPIFVQVLNDKYEEKNIQVKLNGCYIALTFNDSSLRVQEYINEKIQGAR